MAHFLSRSLSDEHLCILQTTSGFDMPIKKNGIKVLAQDLDFVYVPL